MQSTSSLPSLTSLTWPGVVTLDWSLSIYLSTYYYYYYFYYYYHYYYYLLAFDFCFYSWFFTEVWQQISLCAQDFSQYSGLSYQWCLDDFDSSTDLQLSISGTLVTVNVRVRYRRHRWYQQDPHNPLLFFLI